jgi:DNA-binding protein HU-beta
MNKANLIEKVQDMLGGTKTQAEQVVNGIFDTITDSLKNGDDVSISGFGIFKSKMRAARTARNPKTGEAVNVPATQVVKFQVSKTLKDIVKG